MPKVSVLIPTFNREDYVAACISSGSLRHGQTSRSWSSTARAAIGRGGRSSGWRRGMTGSGPSAYATNTGPVRGWWRCLEEARGEFATFLWSDDLHRREFLAWTIDMLSDDVAFVTTAAEIGSRPGSGEVCYWRPTGLSSVGPLSTARCVATGSIRSRRHVGSSEPRTSVNPSLLRCRPTRPSTSPQLARERICSSF